MTLNVSLQEFKEKWSVAKEGENVYTNGSLRGIIQYEDDNYIVIKLEK